MLKEATGEGKGKLLPVIIFCAVFIGVLLIFHFTVGRMVIGNCKKVKGELLSKQEKLQESEELIKRIPNPKKAIEEIERKFEDFSDVGVTKKHLPKLVQILGEVTSENNINVISIKPREDIKLRNEDLPAGVSKIFIEMNLICTYRVFGEFVNLLPKLQPGFSIESLIMKKTNQQQEILAKKTGDLDTFEQPLLIKVVLSTYMVWEL